MAVNIGPIIGINGEAEYRKQLNNIIQQTKTLGSEMKALSGKFDSSNASMKQNREQAKLLGDAIAAQKEKIKLQADMLDEASKKYGDNATQTLRWKQAVADSKAELARLEAELKQIPNSLQLVGEKMQKIGDGFAKVGKNLSLYVTGPILAIGTAATKVTMDFDKEMSKVSAISGATGDDLDKLRNKAKEMGETTKFSASESAEALEYMAMAGWKTKDMLNGISGVMDLAAASGEDLATTSDIVTDALTAFGESAESSGHFADVLASVSSNANTNVSMMGETFKYVGPLAGALGYSIEDVAYASGLMANSGIKAEQAGTSLRGMLTRLAKPTKQSKEAMDKLNVSLTDSKGKMKPLGTLITELRSRFANLTEAERAQYAAMLAGQNGMSGFLALVNATDEDVQKLASALGDAEGAAHDMAETMQDNLAGQLTILKSQLEGAGIKLGEILVPYLSKAVNVISDLVDKFSKLSPETQENIVIFGTLAAAAGPALTVLGKVASTVGSITSTFGDLASKIPGLFSGLGKAASAMGGMESAALGAGRAMAAMPIVSIVAALGTLAFVIGKAIHDYYSLDSAVDSLNDKYGGLVDKVDDTANSLANLRQETNKLKADAEANNKIAQTSIERLKKLQANSDGSADSIAMMRAEVRRLNALFPDLGLEIDNTTGALNKSITELELFINTATQTATVQAQNDMLAASFDKVSEATSETIQAELMYRDTVANRKAVQEKIDIVTEAYRDQEGALESLNQAFANGVITQEEYDHLQGRIKASTDVFAGGAQALNNELTLLNAEMHNVSQEETVAKQTMDEARKSEEALTKASDEYQKQLDEEQAAIEAENAAQEQSQEVLKKSISIYGEAAESFSNMSDSTQKRAIDVATAITNMQKDVNSALESQMNMFEAFDKKSAMSTDELLKNMKSQIDGVTDWEKNLAELADKGINKDLLQHLASMGPEGAGYVQTFNNMTSDELKQANTMWIKSLNIKNFTNGAGRQLTEGIAEVTVGGRKRLIKLGEDLGVEAEGSGRYVGEGIIKGLKNVSSEVGDNAELLGEETINAINKALGVKSPSRYTTQSGYYVGKGLANGILDSQKDVKVAIKTVEILLKTDMIDPATQHGVQLKSVGSTLIKNLASAIQSGVSSVKSAISGVISSITGGISQLKSTQAQFTNIGSNLMSGLANGIKNGASSVLEVAKNTAKAAAQAAKDVLGIHSPSKVAEKEIGQMFTAGIAKGVKNGASALKKNVTELTGAMIQTPVTFTPAYAGGYSEINNSYDYGGLTVNVYGSQGQDVNQLADLVSYKIDTSLNKMRRAFGE